MQTVLQTIEELTKELETLQPLKPEYQQKLDKKFRLEFNYNSNHLEGNTLTYGETELLLIFDNTKGNHTHREYEEMKAHDVAYHLIQEMATVKEHPLTEAFIKNLNRVILVRPFWKEAITQDGQNTRRQIKIGDYKAYPNSVRLQNGEMFHYTSPAETPIKMGELMEWYKQTEKEKWHPLIIAAFLHYKFVCIHPFDDGNGRISRLLTNYVLLQNNLPPIVIKTADKKNYLAALNHADTGDINAFVKYIGEQLICSMQLKIKAAKGEDIEELDDLDKKISLLEKDLEGIDSNEEVKLRLDGQVYLNIYNSWLKALITKTIPAIQKFNKFFTGTQHNLSLSSGVASVNFSIESPENILNQFYNELETRINNFNTNESITYINAYYGTLIKGGLKTFGCNYGIQIKFSLIKYEIYVDEFSETNERRQQKLYEELLHKPLTDFQIDEVVKKLTEAIYEHIDVNTKKKGLR